MAGDDLSGVFHRQHGKASSKAASAARRIDMRDRAVQTRGSREGHRPRKTATAASRRRAQCLAMISDRPRQGRPSRPPAGEGGHGRNPRQRYSMMASRLRSRRIFYARVHAFLFHLILQIGCVGQVRRLGIVAAAQHQNADTSDGDPNGALLVRSACSGPSAAMPAQIADGEQIVVDDFGADGRRRLVGGAAAVDCRVALANSAARLCACSWVVPAGNVILICFRLSLAASGSSPSTGAFRRETGCQIRLEFDRPGRLPRLHLLPRSRFRRAASRRGPSRRRRRSDPSSLTASGRSIGRSAFVLHRLHHFLHAGDDGLRIGPALL